MIFVFYEDGVTISYGFDNVIDEDFYEKMAGEVYQCLGLKLVII